MHCYSSLWIFVVVVVLSSFEIFEKKTYDVNVKFFLNPGEGVV